jgi:2-methylisocitrate lyase-like PEP mutase family enzyme
VSKLSSTLGGEDGRPSPFIGVYDVFSAAIAGRRYGNLFVSGYGFGASFYGLPDMGLISWSHLVDFVSRLRVVLPRHKLLVDIDDGYGDSDLACHVVQLLERAGAWGVVLEDQRRPRRCGHHDGKQVMELPLFVDKLKRVLATRRELFVVARTDASEPDEIRRRVAAFAEAGADAVLADGVKDLEILKTLSASVDKPLVFNQIAGGKSAPATLAQLGEAGVSLAIYSTPLLFAVQPALDRALTRLADQDGLLPAVSEHSASLADCSSLLSENLQFLQSEG